MKKKQRMIELSSEEFNSCKICTPQVFFKNGHQRIKHLKEIHNLTYSEYCIIVYFNGVHPTCLCGCGTKTYFEYHTNVIFFNDFTTNHFIHKPLSEEKKKQKTEKTKKTNLEKYGTECPLQNEEIQKKTKKTVKQKYNVDHISQSEEIKKKKQETCLRKFNANSPFESEEIKQKVIDKNLKEHGVKYNSQRPDVIKKKENTCLERYGNKNFLGSEEGKKVKRISNLLTKEEFLERHGVDNPMKLDWVKEKSKHTILEKYGKEYFSQTVEWKLKTIQKNLEEFGVDWYSQTEEWKKDMIAFMEINSDDITKKREQTNMERIGYRSEFLDPEWKRKYNSNNPEYEKNVAEAIGGEHRFVYGGREFDVKKDNLIFELDGDYHHPDKLIELSLMQLNSVTNDYFKDELIKNSEYNLYRIHKSNLPENITVENLILNSYKRDYTIEYKQKIMTKEYLKTYKENHDEQELKRYVSLLLKFIRSFQPEFPIIPEPKESLQYIINSIKTYNLERTRLDFNTFNDNVWTVGNNYLKYKFQKSFYNSKNNGMLSSVEAWKDDNIMKKIIEYRIGLNHLDEIFDFSIYQLVKGLSARRYMVSFFKPLLAASIYDYFLTNKDNPVVFDPCAGFGGRMIGFKSRFPNGRYICCEPNIDTYKELIELSKNFTGVEVYNCKIEDFNLDFVPDLTFTSIPYYDTEIYSNHVQYENFEQWKELFINKIMSLPNLVINISTELYDRLSLSCKEMYYIQKSISHFQDKTKKRTELLLKF